MNTLPAFPPEVHRYVASVFGAANRRVCKKLARVPNCSEPSLDLTLVEHLSQFSGPRVVLPGWAIRIDVHYLGGLRHFRSWEVADIGVLIFAKQRSAVVAKKVAVLQSKRLYPTGAGVVEESPEDYRIGFAGLIPSLVSSKSLALAHSFTFAKASRYKALRVADEQYDAIASWEKETGTPVHYLLYNPWSVESTYSYPATEEVALGRASNGGCRVVQAEALRQALAAKSKGYSPSFSDLATRLESSRSGSAGWRLEHFISNLLLRCKQGRVFERLDDKSMFALFNRRSGPIAAAVAVTVEQF